MSRGSTLWRDGNAIMTGEGSGIALTADRCRYLCTTLKAPYVFSLRLTRLSAAHPCAEAGILVRGDNAPAAPAIFFGCTTNGTLLLKSRAQPGDSMVTRRDGRSARDRMAAGDAQAGMRRQPVPRLVLARRRKLDAGRLLPGGHSSARRHGGRCRRVRHIRGNSHRGVHRPLRAGVAARALTASRCRTSLSSSAACRRRR